MTKETKQTLIHVFELMLKHIQFIEDYKTGMCRLLINMLNSKSIITQYEYNIAIDYIRNHTPYCHFFRVIFKDAYYYTKGATAPRVKYINKQLKKLRR